MNDNTGYNWITLTSFSFSAVSGFAERFTFSPSALLLRVDTDDITKEANYTVSISIHHTYVANTPSPSAIQPVAFNLEVIDNPCTANLQVPADNDLDYFVTAVNSTDQTIPLPNISNGDCEFEIELSSITNLTA